MLQTLEYLKLVTADGDDLGMQKKPKVILFVRMKMSEGWVWVG